MNRSTFPSAIDTFVEHYEIQDSDRVSVNRVKLLMSQNTLTTAEKTELTNLITSLRDKIFTPEDFNKLQDCITNMEVFIKDGVEGYINTKQQEFDATLQKFSDKGSYNPSTIYVKWNMVLYNNELFMSKQDNNLNRTPIGDSSDLWWQKIAQRGAQGIPGVGLSFVGNYNNSTPYTVGNAVNYNNSIYYCIADNAGQVPTTPAYWQLFLANSGIQIDSNAPQNPFVNQLWIDTGNGNAIKYWNGSAWNQVGVTLSAFNTHVTNFNNHLNDNSKQVPHLGTTTNSGNAYSIITSETILANQKFTIKFNAASTGASTLIISSIGSAKGIKKQGGSDATLKVGVYSLFYDGTNFQLLGEGGEYGTATASQVLTGYNIGTDNGLVNGTMANYAGTARLASGVAKSGNSLYLYPDANGYYTGASSIYATDNDWIEANIKNGVDIYGKVGTFTGDADALSTDMRSGKKAYVKGLLITGGLVVNPNTIANTNHLESGGYTVGAYSPDGRQRLYMRPPLSNQQQIIEGDVWVTTPADTLVPGNIKSGVSVLGVTGTLTAMNFSEAWVNTTSYTLLTGETVVVGSTLVWVISYGSIRAHRKSDGVQVWTASNPDGGWIYYPFAIGDELWYQTSYSTSWYYNALNSSGGYIHQRRPVGGGSNCSIIAHDGTYIYGWYTSSDNNYLTKVRISDAYFMYTASCSAQLRPTRLPKQPGIFYGGFMYVTTGGTWYKINLTNGSTVATYTTWGSGLIAFYQNRYLYTYFYNTNHGSARIRKIDLETQTVVEDVFPGDFPSDIHIGSWQATQGDDDGISRFTIFSNNVDDSSQIPMSFIYDYVNKKALSGVKPLYEPINGGVIRSGEYYLLNKCNSNRLTKLTY